jgi:hypothetical protein
MAITRRLIEKHGLTIIAVETYWPDAAGPRSRHLQHKPLNRRGGLCRAGRVSQQAIPFLTMLRKNLPGETDATGLDSRHR